jgi:hypothetical protein
MNLRRWLLGAIVPALAVLPALGGAQDKAPAVPQDPPKVTWKRIVLDQKFRSEGVAVADVNKDGKLDIIAGDVWYEAPDWKMHVLRKDAPYDPAVYSESFCCFVDDFNGDGWPDVIIVPFPGKAVHWYENPKGKDEPWKEHLICHSCCNESPQFADLFGKGKKVLIMGVQPEGKDPGGNNGQMCWLAPGEDPTKPWVVHAISDPAKPAPGTNRFSHGLGTVDVNLDGRLDVVCTDGWWEQPKDLDDKPWDFHPAKLGGACADMVGYDVDGDGKMDIITSSAHNFGIWWHNQRPGKDHPAFVQQTLFKDLIAQTHALVCVDIDGDGVKDLVTGCRWWAHGPKGDTGEKQKPVLYWFQAKKGKDGLVTFTPHLIDEDSGIGTQFVVTDVNGDGLPDVVISNKRGVYVFLQVRRKE